MMKLNHSNNQSCLVTGGAGFIGSHLCDRLLGEGYFVYCVDNLLTGSESNIAHLRSHKRFKFIRHDVTLPYQKTLKIEYIFHLASPASPKWYQKYPLETLLVNTYGTHLLLAYAYQAKAKFLYASSSEVYGEPEVHPQDEAYRGNVSTTGPRSCYDEGKRCGESFVMTYARHHQVDARIIRIFNTYGPRMQKDDGRIISNFISQALHHEPLTIYGDGNQTRSFCFISDMVEAIMRAMFTPGTKGKIVNVGNNEEVKVKDVAWEIMTLLEIKLPTKNLDLPTDDPSRRKPNLDFARKLLGWEPRVSFTEGLRETIDFMKHSL